jgi:hypothetical protein
MIKVRPRRWWSLLEWVRAGKLEEILNAASLKEGSFYTSYYAVLVNHIKDRFKVITDER